MVNKAINQVHKIRRLQKATFFAATKLLQQGVLAGALFGIEHLVLPEAVLE